MLLLSLASMARAATTGPSGILHGAYPPSCLSSPLTDAPSGPVQVTQIGTLSTLDAASEYVGTETVDFTFWRVACNAGKSALLMQISRLPNATGYAQWPFSYGIAVSQAGIAGTARLAQEPNTLYSSLSLGMLLDSTSDFVFENTQGGALPPGVAATSFDFNQALTVTIPNVAAIGIDPSPPPITASIPAYDPAQYQDASLALPITGYLSGNWYDPAHGGEGIQTEIGEVTNDGLYFNRYITVAWYTFDSSGTPYWLFGSGGFSAGDRTTTLQLSYSSYGGFAGDFGAEATPQLWGTFNVQFPDCNTMQFTYQSTSGLPSDVPQGSGSKSWTRLTEMSGLACY